MLKTMTPLRIIVIASAAALLFCSACTAFPSGTSTTAPGKPTLDKPLSIVSIIGIGEVMPSTESALLCTVAGNNDSDLTYIWSVEQGTINAEGNKATWTTPSTPGDYAVTVAVSDSKGDHRTVSRTFKVTDNPFNNYTPDSTIYLKFNLPEDKGPSQTPKRLRVWTTSEIECIVAGRDYSELTFKWTAPGGKLVGDGLAEGKAHKVGWIAPGQAGLYKVTVQVTDTAGNSSTGEVNFDIYCCKE